MTLIDRDSMGRFCSTRTSQNTSAAQQILPATSEVWATPRQISDSCRSVQGAVEDDRLTLEAGTCCPVLAANILVSYCNAIATSSAFSLLSLLILLGVLEVGRRQSLPAILVYFLS
jgi:hypothetical protein